MSVKHFFFNAYFFPAFKNNFHRYCTLFSGILLISELFFTILQPPPPKKKQVNDENIGVFYILLKILFLQGSS